MPRTISNPIHLFKLLGLFCKRSKMENFEYNECFDLVLITGSAGCQYFP
jgi:hypothetical protein